MEAAYRSITTTDVESYSRAIPGVELKAIRTGHGFGPNTLRTAVFDDATIGIGSVGFPVRGQLTLSDDWVAAALISSAPPGTRWCGYDLEPGSTLLYAPGSDHTAVNVPGVEYTFVIVHRRCIEEAADELHRSIKVPQSGDVHLLEPTLSYRSIASVLDSVVLPPTDDEHPSMIVRDVMQALVSELGEDSVRRRSERASVRESRRVVRSCLEFAFEAGGRPSTAELCRVAHVSERRLRNAFVNAFGVAPMTYFRDQKLNEARSQLLATSNRRTVMEISTDIGIENGGRFAQRYFELFGELPSTTLQTAH
jgi:AraC-like DNA-binding protein